ncbi:MAG: hypothetical protein ACYCX4_07850 [Bacillota bacterium]
MRYPSWQYDELKQVGVDYTDIKEVQAYDSHLPIGLKKVLSMVRQERAKALSCLN